ncbi:MAG: Mrp/NBP35 family ATP-binding protein [Candidatus Binatia bacterium]|nr:Mrp/NBP35 family ATP-binding protein [Candidatus Binatia bacterium]
MSDDKASLEDAKEALRSVTYPGFPRDIVTLGMVAGLEGLDGAIRVNLRLPAGRTEPPEQMQTDMAAALAPLGLRLEIRVAAPAARPQAPAAAPATPDKILLPDVKAVIAVSSAKGGVGKSTVATNLACAFAEAGFQTGLLDADVYGPSLPILMGVQQRPKAAGENKFHPVVQHGVKCVSMGFFLDEESPVIWRGPMVAGLLQQFLRDCMWGSLDILVIDLPPGTGDAQLTLAQQVPLSGAVLVTTPQEVAVRDVMRGLRMFGQVQVPMLGVIENMSHFRCPECGAQEALFGHGGGDRVAEASGLPVLARIPVEAAVREHGDGGQPIVAAAPDSDAARVFTELASQLSDMVGIVAAEPSSRGA